MGKVSTGLATTEDLVKMSGLTQIEIAAICGVTPGCVSRVLSGSGTSSRVCEAVDRLAGVEAGTCARLAKEQGRARMEAIRARVLKEKAITRKDN